jgi:hypothetical protein
MDHRGIRHEGETKNRLRAAQQLGVSNGSWSDLRHAPTSGTAIGVPVRIANFRIKETLAGQWRIRKMSKGKVAPGKQRISWFLKGSDRHGLKPRFSQSGQM